MPRGQVLSERGLTRYYAPCGISFINFYDIFPVRDV